MSTSATEPTPSQFTIGETYTATSACDSDCTWGFEVVSRTARFITIRELGRTDGMQRRVGVRAHDGEEWASPFGTYSLAPVIRSGRTLEVAR